MRHTNEARPVASADGDTLISKEYAAFNVAATSNCLERGGAIKVTVNFAATMAAKGAARGA